MGVTVTLIAILELAKNGLLKIHQANPFDEITIETCEKKDESN